MITLFTSHQQLHDGDFEDLAVSQFATPRMLMLYDCTGTLTTTSSTKCVGFPSSFGAFAWFIASVFLFFGWLRGVLGGLRADFVHPLRVKSNKTDLLCY